MDKITNPRQLAILTLNEWEKTGDFLREVLDLHLRQSNLSPLDQGLYTELVYGTVRMRRNLDYVLATYSSRPLRKIKVAILNILRTALYQILYLDRIPSRATVNEAVKLARLFGHEGVVKFTNGLLRQVVRSGGNISYPPKESDPVEYLGLKYSFPAWIIENWLELWGWQETSALCQALNLPPKLHIRVNTLKNSREELKLYLKAEKISSSAGNYAADILEVSPAHLVVQSSGLKDGLYYIQDESSALGAHALQVTPGQLVYDLCSAPGGKATHLAQLMENRGRIICFDVSADRLKLVDENSQRLGITIIETRVADAAKDLGLTPVPRVLVDAPCSGLGGMAHRPDVRWNKNPQDILEMAALQKRILTAAANYVAPGGLLLYSTCTLTKEENQAVAEWFLANFPKFSGFSFPDWFPSSTEPGYMRTFLPNRHGLEGFFLAVFRNVGV